jgi:two-component sensor histidine kinase
VAALLDTTPDRSRLDEGDQLSTLVETIEKLSAARTAEDVAAVVLLVARRVCGADGVTVVLRDGDQCHYLDEDAIGPLWKGRRFALNHCISGWAMLNRQTAIIPDIYADERIPHDAYRPTFVRSLVMTPVRADEPIAAIGAYWAEIREFSPREIAHLEVVARATATALENVRLIESLKTALAQRDGLIRELDHRVKNNLASVRAIAQQTLRTAPSPERFNEAFNGRLMALARGHELVARSAGAGIRLGDAIREGAAEVEGERLSLHGPEVLLAAETAVNVLLGARELAANAVSHGALSRPEGRVEVSWLVAGGRLELEWREFGGPPAEAPEKSGFGFRMLQTGMPRSLGGFANLYLGADGLRYRVFAPLSAAIRAGEPTT